VDQDLLLLTCGGYGNVVRVVPALIVRADEIADGVQRLAAALKVGLGG
jgi:4-aminobutyrate aminotransferase